MKTLVYVIVIIIVAIAASSGVYVWNQSSYSTIPAEPVVQNGSYVSVLYYGYLIYPGGQMRVFDTNIKAVAQNNITYPKTLTFHYPSYFLPLNYTVGSGQMIKGFDKGIIGMRQGQTKKIVVPPALGYAFNWSKVKNISEYQNIPVYQTMSISKYVARTGHTPVLYAINHDKVYGWNDQVLYVNSVKNTVTISNNALAHHTYYPYPNFKKYSVFVNKITNNQTISLTVHTAIMILLPDGGIVDKISNGIIMINYNKEVAGKTLYFVVTILKVSPHPP